MILRRFVPACMTLAVMICVSCTGEGGDGSAAGDTPASGATSPAADSVKALAAAYATLLEGDYRAALDGARTLQERVDAFCAEPTAAGLTAAQEAWLAARPAYQRTEIGRFYDGPIDREGGPEGDINPWPLDEVYIDGTGEAAAGIISKPDAYPTIDEATLRQANGAGGEENISTGWHAVEYMLWGVDDNPEGPGRRDWRDFQDDGTRPHAERRRAYLRLVTGMLVSDLESVQAEWAPEGGAYRQEFLAAEPNEILRRILTGIGTLAKGELRGERLLTPFTTKEQEDEHSCFSDTTHIDHRQNLAGIANVWREAGLRDLAVEVGFDVTELDAALAEVEAAMDDPAFTPFDQAIVGADTTPGRQAVSKAISGLARFDGELTRLAEALGVNVVTSLPG